VLRLIAYSQLCVLIERSKSANCGRAALASAWRPAPSPNLERDPKGVCSAGLPNFDRAGNHSTARNRKLPRHTRHISRIQLSCRRKRGGAQRDGGVRHFSSETEAIAHIDSITGRRYDGDNTVRRRPPVHRNQMCTSGLPRWPGNRRCR